MCRPSGFQQIPSGQVINMLPDLRSN